VSTDEAVKPLRRDAAENRERVIEAAGVVFAEHGLDAGVDEVAKLAGVGMGTVYRRFPTKQALIDELIGSLRRELLRLAEVAAERTDGTGLEELLVAVGQLQAEQAGCLQQLMQHSDAESETLREFRLRLGRLLAEAQRQGRVRTEVTRGDISMLLWSLSGVIQTTRSMAPNAWRRHLELFLAGLRPAGAAEFSQPLQEKPLTIAQAEQATRARN
jgi:AcrR family transcriptional regulator